MRETGWSPIRCQREMFEGSWPQYERTWLNEPLVYRLCHQVNRRVAMFGGDKR